MAYTLGQYKRDVASGKIKNPEEWTYKRVIDWQSKTRSARTKARTSGDPLAQSANAMTNQILSGAISGLTGLKPGVTAEAQRLAQQEMAAAQGVATALRPYAKDIQNIYTSAGNALSGAAQGFSTEVGSMLDADTNKNNMNLARLGLDPQTTKMGGLVTDVLYGQQYPAARGFITAGRDYGAAAAMRPGTAILQGQQFAAQRRAAGQDQLSKIDEEIAKIQGQRPETYQSVYDTLFNRDLKQKEFSAQRGNDAWQRYIDQQKLVQEAQAAAAAASALGLKAEAEAFDQKIRIEQLKLDQYEAEARAQSYIPDPKIITGKNGSIVRVNPDGSVVQLAPPGTTGTQATTKPKGTTLTADQQQAAVEKAAELASSFFYGTVLDDKGKRILAKDAPGFDPANADSYGQDALGYQEAFKRMKTRFPKLGNRQILALLNEHYDTPGADGRPWFDMFERAKLKKLGFTQAQIRKAMRPEYRATAISNRMLTALGRAPITAAATDAAEAPKISISFEEAARLKKAGYTDEEILAIAQGKAPYMPAPGPGAK